MPTQITALAVSKSFNGRPVLDSVTCSLTAGERTGIIGENGSGKTTLLRLFAGRERPDQGEVIVQAGGGVGYLAQDGRLAPQATVQQIIEESLSDLRAVEARMRHLEAAMAGDDSAMAEYGDLLTLFELRGGYDADARVERALHGLGLGTVGRDRVVGSLSGGEQVRLRLASVLAAAPEVLLLDEPTNHLDESALSWLEEHLRTRRGTTVAVSHDRAFLERVATSLLEVDADRRTVVRYGNGYAGYLAEKAAARQRWGQAYERWLADLDRLREAAATTARQVAPGRPMKDGNKMAYDRAGGRVQQSLAGRVRNAEERIRRLLADPVPRPPEPLRFAPVLRARRLQGVVLDAAGVAVTDRLDRTSLSVTAGERLLITGRNGAGKSTLLRVLAGELAPDSGSLTRRGRIGYLPQEPDPGRPKEPLLAAFARGQTGETAGRPPSFEDAAGRPPSFDLEDAAGRPPSLGLGDAAGRLLPLGPEDAVEGLLPLGLEEAAERLLALGLFDSEQFTVPVGRLSTGQRQRLALARLLSRPSDVLLLDEPTNHLSPALVEDLEAALTGYDGAVVAVSHDRRLRRRWQGAHLEIGAASPVRA